MFLSPQNLFVDTLTPKKMVLRGELHLPEWDQGPYFKKPEREGPFPLLPYEVLQKVGWLTQKARFSVDAASAYTLTLDFAVSKTVRNKFWCL